MSELTCHGAAGKSGKCRRCKNQPQTLCNLRLKIPSSLIAIPSIFLAPTSAAAPSSLPADDSHPRAPSGIVQEWAKCRGSVQKATFQCDVMFCCSNFVRLRRRRLPSSISSAPRIHFSKTCCRELLRFGQCVSPPGPCVVPEDRVSAVHLLKVVAARSS